ncbi:non-ribosomal peptide synthetase [Streptomyces formicae]|uniref:Peptide synthetase n=1 Tax=Streptomyces formicae TaxID=1616117 RepID=A0A291QA83_9ACTN|nr:amino acid adenylation domain-containing protein [Streptomyces formicae]ATL28468.1 Peptide synthetase [Streptomyces formicae]
METAPSAFWQRVLTGGGFTPLPRWPECSAEPVGVVGHPVRHDSPGATAAWQAAVPERTARALRSLRERSGVSLDTAVLAAYVKILAQVTADPVVTFGCLLPPAFGAEDPVPCRMSVGHGTWARLLDDMDRNQADVVRHLDALPTERGTGGAGPLHDALFVTGRAPRAADLAADTVLAVGLDQDGDEPTLVLRHRPKAVGPDQAGRFAGYLLAALDALSAEPDADHYSWNPLTAAEVTHQIRALAGPDRELPDRRVHELIEEQVRLRPDEVAAVHNGTSWTYRQLDQRANRVAHALIGAGLRAEDVVAVVTERDLEWLSAVLAVFKAGGVYLPVEPQFPADRVADMLERSECRHVLTRRGVSRGLDEAAARMPDVHVDDLDRLADPAAGPDTAPKVPVAAGQSAYIYFTSGSTGTPKGAVCEHAGFLNHVLAKIDDLGIAAGGTVAQTAPQCFDISLWQLVAALTVGGCTVIVDQAAVEDVARLVDTLATEHVEVLQIVPSYLETMLTELDRTPRPLPRLRCVSATGEALKKELAERWFATFPDVALVNAYGLTETSDDTNHEVMRSVPDAASVPLGRPVANVRVYVVDESLRPVPLGSPGEIAFSGVCVGRGYVNDEERTRAAFVPDPHVPGARLYRSGDIGRWLPGGRLEFLGRRDAQVKIRGFRIEIGEIENRLLQVPGVRDSAVVVVGTDGAKQLAAFWTGSAELSATTLSAALGETLPAYMVPSHFHRLPELPLTGNGKTDRKALTRIAAEMGAGHGESGADNPAGEVPSTGAERRLAALWAEVLKVPAERIGRDSDFFGLGGTSLTLVRLAIALDRTVSPRELQETPRLADLAALLDGRGTEAGAHDAAPAAPDSTRTVD